jgi:beta-lactam-binding protein with PASTA domain
VPDVRGGLLERAKAGLVSAGCSLGGVTRAFSKKVKRGRVISEHPGPGAGLPKLARVSLVVSKGRPRR